MYYYKKLYVSRKLLKEIQFVETYLRLQCKTLNIESKETFHSY